MSVTGSVVSPILVGRDALLELGERRLVEVASGRGQLLFLAGEAGIGKTRLLGAIVRKAEAKGFVIAGCDVGVRDLEVAGSLFFDLTHSMSGRESFRPVRAAILDRLTHGWRSEFEVGGHEDASQRRRELVHDIADLLMTVPTPSLLYFENLQWADDLSLDILGAFARRVHGSPILAIGTYRSDELYPRIPMREWRSRLLTQRLAEEARLGRLSPADTGTMTTLLLASGLPAPQDVVNAIHDRTDGIPLHVEELLGSLRDDDGWTGPSIVSADVPDTIEMTVRERLERRSPAARSLAEAGAVIGRCFVVDVAAGVLATDAEGLSAPLQELIDHFFLVKTQRPGLYDFRHALIRDAIYEAVPEPTRRRMHASVAELGAGLPGAGDAFRSGHYELAGRTDEAFDAAVAGAAAAVRWSAHREAALLYRRALRNLPEHIDSVRHANLLDAFATEAAALDDNETAAEAWAQARGEYLAAGRPVEAAAVTAPLVAVRHLLGHDLESRVRALDGALRDLDGSPPGRDVEAARLGLQVALSAAYMLARHLPASIDHGRRAVALAIDLGDEPSELHATITIGADLVFEGHMAEGWAAIESAIERARAADLDEVAARGYRMIGSSASVLVEYPRAERWLRVGIAFAERVELWNHRHYMAAHLGHVLWASGRWDEAEDVARHALADGRGGITTRITALHVIGYVALGRGDLVGAGIALEEARELGSRMGELQRLSPALWGLAETALADGATDRAAELCEQGLAASAAVDDAAYLFPFVVTGTRAYLALGDPGAARGWLARVRGPIERRGIPGTLPAIDHAAGLLAMADGTTAKARAALESAADRWKTLDRAWEGAWARVDLGRCHRRANQAVPAARATAAAVDAARRLGAPAIEAAAVALRARSMPLPPWAPLTARQFEVARMVAAGSTNLEIAVAMGLTRKTVASHVEHILAKLDVGRRPEIAAWVASGTMASATDADPAPR